MSQPESVKEDFKNYLKKIQPNIPRIVIPALITTILLPYGEISAFQAADKLQIVGCALFNNNSYSEGYGTVSSDTCFFSNMSQCISSQYTTINNDTLEFQVPFSGVSGDSVGRGAAAGIVLFLFGVIFTLQVLTQLITLKRKRIQDLLGVSGVYILTDKREELRRALFLFVLVACYILSKTAFFINRVQYYSRIECNGEKYHLDFTLTTGTYLGSLIQSGVIFLLMTLQYTSFCVNFLSDMDFRNMTLHFSAESIAYIPRLLVLSLKDFNELVESKVDQSYMHLSYFPRLLKRSVFIFPWSSVSNQELTEYLEQLKLQNPALFKTMVASNASLGSINVLSGDDEHAKLL